MERGVIFTPVEMRPIETTNRFKMVRGVTKLDINYFLLYWDKLVSPSNNNFHFGLPYEDELISSGKLERPMFSSRYMDDSMITAFFADAQMKSLDVMKGKNNKVDWRMHFLNEEISLPKSELIIKQALRFDLYNLLPVPGENVHINEILEFKERRADELITLHSYMDELYKEVMTSFDLDLSRAKSISGLKKAIADLDSLNNQTWKSPIKFNISSSFELDLNQCIAAGAAGLAALTSDHPLEFISIGAVATVLGGMVRVTPQMQNVLKGQDKNLSYVTKAKREGVLGV